MTYRIKYCAEEGNEERSSVSRSMLLRVASSTEAGQNRERGMVLPFEPLSITFDEIKYAVDMPQVLAKTCTQW